MIDLARKVEEEMVWRVQLNDRDYSQDLVEAAEAFERTNRMEKAERMKYTFKLRNEMELVELADYKNEGRLTRRKRQSGSR